jgi:thiamine-phosphate pyrophosphorylase
LLLYYITDCSQFPGDEHARRRCLLEKIRESVRCGVDYIQLREKDLSARELEMLVREAVAAVRESRTGDRKTGTILLINSRTDIAIACGAEGVHLRSDDIALNEVRNIWTRCGADAPAKVGVSCHTPKEVACAAMQGADFAVFGPVFEKKSGEKKIGGNHASPGSRPVGLDALRQACRERIPVLALGGVNAENAPICIQAGAAGIAGIRLFQENEIWRVVRRLRRSTSQPTSND